jgi:hypothetical protein
VFSKYIFVCAIVVPVQVFKPSEKFAKIFQFKWDDTDDTGQDFNPLYAKPMQVAPLFGRGYIAGFDMKEQRKQYQFVDKLAKRRQQDLDLEHRKAGDDHLEDISVQEENLSRLQSIAAKDRADIEKMERTTIGLRGSHWSEKKLEDMTERDWRIFREDFDIRLRGGRFVFCSRFPVCSIVLSTCLAVLGKWMWVGVLPVFLSLLLLGARALWLCFASCHSTALCTVPTVSLCMICVAASTASRTRCVFGRRLTSQRR